MKKSSSIIPAIATTCALAFSAISAPAGEGGVEAKPWREIATGTQSNIEEATREVIQDQETWAKWWSSHNTVTNMIDGKVVAVEPPKVDFETETVIVATLGMRSTGGHTVGFSDIRRDGDVVTAVLKTTSPGPDDPVTMALTHPFAIIAIPKHNGTVNFVVE